MELIIYMQMDLALNNLKLLICHKTQPNQTKPNIQNQTLTIRCRLLSHTEYPVWWDRGSILKTQLIERADLVSDRDPDRGLVK